MFFGKLTLLIIAAAAVGCSNQQIYDAAQGNHRLECQKLPQGQYEDCMAEISESYEEYTRKRREDELRRNDTPDS